MAEYLLRHRCAGKLQLTVRSAGTAAWPGAPSSPAALTVMKELDIDLTQHRSQTLSAELIDESDLIVVMTTAHRDAVCNQFPAADEKTHLLHSFGTANRERDVADPYGLSVAAYRKTRDEIDSALSDLIIHINEMQTGNVQ
jgi:protein-tyrosine phosphatase